MARFSPVPLWPQNGDTTQLPKGQYVFYDPPAGEYVIYYTASTGTSQAEQPTLLRFGTHSLVSPQMNVTVASTGSGTFQYIYDISNRSDAKQPIQKISMLVYSDSSPHAAQTSWSSTVGSSGVRDLAAPAATASAIDWTPNIASQSISPGSTVTGFTVDSTSRPGFIRVIFRGASTSHEYNSTAVASLPKEVRDQVASVFTLAWDAKTILAIGPRFSKGASQSQIAQNFFFGIQSLMRDGKLDPNSPFIQSTMRLLSGQLESNDTVTLNVNSLALSEAKAGLEATIANALQAVLAQ
ncbi:MAG TPA: hypothetical protein VN633_04195 [Bryobacteraceae bacterium]|nr:hypothetical protein [Bryobacteraceae bacterium]